MPRFVKVAVVACLGLSALAATVRGQDADAALGPMADTTIPFWVVCSSVSQLCSPPFEFTVGTDTVLEISYRVPSHCSSVRVHLFVDGVLKATSGFLGWPGASGPFGSLPLETGFLDVGPVASGTHLVAVQGEGQVSGCNTGRLFQWGGTLSVRTSSVPLAVPIDVRPRGCPNALNAGSQGVLPVAVVGADGFEASTVDPASIRLVGVAPRRSGLEDVATPFEPYLGKQDSLDCTLEGADGLDDLTLSFATPEVVAALEAILGRELRDGEVLALPLTGALAAEHGGRAIVGEDVVLVHRR